MSDARLAAEPQAPTAGWQHRIEAAGARLFFAIMSALPLDAASAAGGALGRIIGPRLAISDRAWRNLAGALPEVAPKERRRIVALVWENLGRVAAEYPHLARFDVFGAASRVEIRGLAHIEEALAAGRQIILFSGHLGNWELAPLAAAQYGLDMTHFYRAANNPLVDRMIARFRCGGDFAPKGAAGSRRVFAALRRGGHVGMLVDQKLNDGIAVPFFGRPAMTAPALALLALHFDCVVLPARVERRRGARFQLTVYPPLSVPRSGDRGADIAALMAEVNRTLEAWIRERPGQWFWLHRRWLD
jgi:Kdo2-lipid IVA lauroyltransferase/acyltransferase